MASNPIFHILLFGGGGVGNLILHSCSLINVHRRKIAIGFSIRKIQLDIQSINFCRFPITLMRVTIQQISFRYILRLKNTLTNSIEDSYRKPHTVDEETAILDILDSAVKFNQDDFKIRIFYY